MNCVKSNFHNSVLKLVSDMLNHKKRLIREHIPILSGSEHITRHTFAVTVTLTNSVRIESIGKMPGHTKRY